MRLGFLAVLVSLSAILSSCGADDDTGTADGPEGTGGTVDGAGGATGIGGTGGGAGEATGTGGGSGGNPASSVTSEQLFDPSRVAAIELEIAASDWDVVVHEAGIEAVDPTYVRATFTYDGLLLGEIMVRAKGHLEIASDGTYQPSLKLDFDRVVDEQEFADQVKLNLHNAANDPSQLREYLSYGAWRDHGVPAPRTGWADLSVNGEALGLYTVVQQVGGKFVEDHFPDHPEGDLYQPELPAGTLQYRGPAIEDYPEVDHERVDGTDHAAFLHFVDVLNHGTDAELSSVLDVNGALTYLAGSVALGNLSYYVGGGDNYYLYESSAGVFTLIPWDMDQSQEDATEPCGLGTNPSTPEYDFVLSGRLLGDPIQLETYFGIMREILQGAGSVVALTQRIDAAEGTLADRLDPVEVNRIRSYIETRVPGLLTALEFTNTCPLATM